MEQDAGQLADAVWAVARRDGQCARVVADDETAAAVRARIRSLAAADGVRVRTARMGDAVVAVRLDAAIWTDDARTMRAKLTPTRDA